jgi:branched-chain amino acid transport system substrate-binding protein
MKVSSFLFKTLLVLICLTLLSSGCTTITPIQIGFSAELTGKQNELAINLRNGVQMAVDDINAVGGINGRKIELTVEDDLGTPEGAIAADNKLIDAGVVAIVGHLTSGQTAVGYQVATERDTVLISATASTANLTGIDDLFFCTTPSTLYLGNEFARYIFTERGITSLAIILDQDNYAYSSSLADAFTTSYEEMGGSITTRVSYSGKTVTDFIPYVYGLRLSDPHAVLIIASPPDAGIIAQQIRLQKWEIPLFSAPWARGAELLRNGGSAVEGLELIIAYDSDTPNAELEAFITRYLDHYTQQPAFTAVYGYEVIQVLAAALEKTNGQAEGLADALANISNVETLTASVSLNEYGDTTRPLFIQKIQDGKFITVKQITIQD